MKYSHLIGLLMAAFGVGSVYSFEYSKKTFLMPRAVGVNNAMAFSTWHAQIYEVKEDSPVRQTNVQLTPFFQQSVNRDETGRYFSVGNGTNSIVIGSAPADATLKADVNGSAITGFQPVLTPITDPATAPVTTPLGTVTFNPDQSIWGARLDYLQYVGAPVGGLFFKVSSPIVSVSNNMNMTVANAKSVPFYTGGPVFTLADFFSGNTSVAATSNTLDAANTVLRSPLTKAKMAGRRSATGFADVDLTLGYRYYQSNSCRALFNLCVTVPTGNRAHGEYLFEPIYGNGKHAGLGVGVDAGLQLWNGKQGELWFDTGLQYKYLFEGTEARTVGIKGMPFAQYFLMSSIHKSVNPQPFFPAANLLTQDLRVKPGSQLEALANLSFKGECVVADIGYNLYWKDQESLWVKSWADNTVGILVAPTSTTPIVSTNGAISVANFVDNKYINTVNLDVDAAKTPAQITHKIHGGLAYYGVLPYNCAGSLAFGASYEFSEDNSALEQYAVWLKASFSL